jgi:hypothetical protein
LAPARLPPLRAPREEHSGKPFVFSLPARIIAAAIRIHSLFPVGKTTSGAKVLLVKLPVVQA